MKRITLMCSFQPLSSRFAKHSFSSHASLVNRFQFLRDFKDQSTVSKYEIKSDGPRPDRARGSGLFLRHTTAFVDGETVLTAADTHTHTHTHTCLLSLICHPTSEDFKNQS